MIHYSVWFSFRAGVEEAEGLSAVRDFLDELATKDAIHGFAILRNRDEAGRTRMPPFQALIEFSSDDQFSSAFAAQSAAGIRTGLHGRMMALVGDFQVEVFKSIEVLPELALCACEI